MIPYDDLVAALQAWRARQGLPVSAPASGSNGQVSRTTPAGGYAAQRPTPPSAPPAPPPAAAKRSTTAPRMPLPLQPADTADEQLDNLEVDNSLIEESHYENEGDDFAMSFGGNGRHHKSSDETLVSEDVPDATDPARSHNTREDW
ncbi:MAG TPA: hypothetical protein VGG74_31630 [Kofleriaceae bacterium]|jgi:hypothetical protein